ncbi:MAG TPA: HlyD family efflux transporter periplasmic adaptor subunit [Rudaea sp.]|jgi:multidrug resistance efflux pump|uniref:efflux RND transporter periplasmic adaptor subunit n=1 Tax=Rudaea sp. TaxID=2136325 RepID=UPI002F9376E2
MIGFDQARLIIPVFAGVALLLLAACGKNPSATPPGSAASTTQNFVAIARGKVDVEGGLVHVAAARDGVVTELHGDVGGAVKAGDVLVVLDTKQAQIAADLAKADLDAANAQAALLRAKLPGLKQRAARVLEASQAGAASGQSADDVKQALAELNAEIAVADTGIEAAKQKIRQAVFEVEARTLRTPVAGHIVARNTHIGDVVSAQASLDLVELLPDTPRIVRAELNEGFVAKVSPGMSAEVYSEVDSAKIYPAKVMRIGEVFGPSKLTESSQEATDTRDVECILELTNSDLKVGQRVQVRFLPQAK